MHCLDIEVHRGARDESVVRATGEVDMATADALRTVLAPLVGRGGTVVLDAAHITFCDSSGLRILLQTHRDARAHGGAFRLATPSGPVTRVLELAGALNLLEVFPDTATALHD